MIKALFYDTETSGLPLFNDPSEDPRQPHIVQLGARMVDMDTRQVISTIDLIVRPDGWEIPDDVAAVHGITTAMATECGVSESMAVGIFMELWDRCDFRVAHNETFDARILRIALKRFGTDADAEADHWKAARAECTARMSTPICNLPPTAKMVAARRNHAKTPNLAEAYEFFTGKKLEGGHRALIDVDACMTIYFAMMDRDKVAS